MQQRPRRADPPSEEPRMHECCSWNDGCLELVPPLSSSQAFKVSEKAARIYWPWFSRKARPLQRNPNSSLALKADKRRLCPQQIACGSSAKNLQWSTRRGWGWVHVEMSRDKAADHLNQSELLYCCPRSQTTMDAAVLPRGISRMQLWHNGARRGLTTSTTTSRLPAALRPHHSVQHCRVTEPKTIFMAELW